MPGSTTPRVLIRMYRNILGDCFVLSVIRGKKRKVTVIDCGVLQNVKDGPALLASLPAAVISSVGQDRLAKVRDGNTAIRAVADDVASYLEEHNNGVVDLLVVTHEHFDHVSGFALAQDVWQNRLAINQLWLAWTEKPDADPALVRMRADMDAAKRAIRRTVAAAPHLGAAGQSEEMASVEALAAFLGPDDGDPLAASGGIPGTAETLRQLKAKAGRNVRYCEPGEVIPAAEAAGLKAYVLGPPHNVARLRKDSPSGGASKEVYLVNADQAFAVEAAALLAMRRGEPALPAAPAAPEVERSVANQPFARNHQQSYPVTVGEAESAERKAIRALYEVTANAGLRIEDEWLSGAEALALKLDSDTNNTSLVLAFEMPDADRRVLLFAADAQVGNWLSWGDQTYPPPKRGGADDPGDEPEQKIEDILGRAVFYKVGHHGSHNATLRARGLELMTDKRLVAAIPVVTAIAQVQGKGRKQSGRGWEMPYADLLADLKARTRNRIVTGDGDPMAEAAAFAQASDGQDPVAVKHHPDGLWVELEFPYRPAPA